MEGEEKIINSTDDRGSIKAGGQGPKDENIATAPGRREGAGSTF